VLAASCVRPHEHYLRISVLLRQPLKYSNQLHHLPPHKRNTVFHLEHGRTVLYVLRRCSPVDVFGMLGRDHLGHLLDQREHWVPNNVRIDGEFLETLYSMSATIDGFLYTVETNLLDLSHIAAFCDGSGSFFWHDPSFSLCSRQRHLYIDHPRDVSLVRKDLSSFFGPKQIAKDSRVDGGGVHGVRWCSTDKQMAPS
jgi:hypothetical protein